MINELKLKLEEQLKVYEKEHKISLFDDLGMIANSIATKCQTYAPHYFTDEHIKNVSKLSISKYKDLINSDEFIMNSKELINNGTFAEKTKTIVVDTLEQSFCEGFAETFLTEWGKGNFQKGMRKFLQAMFCNKKNYEYFYINSKEFASLSNSIKEEYAKDFKKDRNHWFHGYLKFQNAYLIIAMFPIALPYLLLKSLTKRIMGISTSREKMVKDPYLTEMFVILEKAGYWK